MGEDTASGFPLSGGRIHQNKYALYPGRCALSLEPSPGEAVGDLADPPILEPRWEMQGCLSCVFVTHLVGSGCDHRCQQPRLGSGYVTDPTFIQRNMHFSTLLTSGAQKSVKPASARLKVPRIVSAVPELVWQIFSPSSNGAPVSDF